MMRPRLTSARELTAFVEEVGFIPLFRGIIPDFSVEELIPEGALFAGGEGDPWSWREQVALEGKVAYAKLFRGRAGFVSMEMYPHLANFRREGYDFDARVDDGLVPDGQRRLYELIASGMYLASELRRAYGGKGFEAALTALQMRTYITITGFEYKKDRYGRPYGWSTACYAVSERAFGAQACTGAYDIPPEASFEALARRFNDYMPGADAKRLFEI